MNKNKILIVGAGLGLASAARAVGARNKDIIIVEDSSPPWDIAINGKTYKKIQHKKNPNYLKPYKYDDEPLPEFLLDESQIIKEFELIDNKKSELSRQKRDAVVAEFFKIYRLV